MTTCLLIIDMQNDVIDPCWEAEAVTGRIATLVDHAREHRIPVLWVQHEDADYVRGTKGWELSPRLQPADGEPVIAKNYRDAFAATDLDARLRALGVDRIVLAGAQSDYCIRTTLQRAVQEGYDVVLVSDGHTTTDAQTPLGVVAAKDIVGHVTMYASGLTYPGHHCTTLRAADALETDEV